MKQVFCFKNKEVLQPKMKKIQQIFVGTLVLLGFIQGINFDSLGLRGSTAYGLDKNYKENTQRARDQYRKLNSSALELSLQESSENTLDVLQNTPEAKSWLTVYERFQAQLKGADYRNAGMSARQMISALNRFQGNPKTFAQMLDLSTSLCVGLNFIKKDSFTPSEIDGLVTKTLLYSEKAYGTGSLQHFDALITYANLYDSAKRFREGQQLFQKAMQALPNDQTDPTALHRDRLYLSVGDHERSVKRYADAETAYMKSFNLLRLHYGSMNGYLKDPAKKLVDLYKISGDPGKSKAWYAQYKLYRQALIPPNSISKTTQPNPTSLGTKPSNNNPSNNPSKGMGRPLPNTSSSETQQENDLIKTQLNTLQKSVEALNQGFSQYQANTGDAPGKFSDFVSLRDFTAQGKLTLNLSKTLGKQGCKIAGNRIECPPSILPKLGAFSFSLDGSNISLQCPGCKSAQESLSKH
ncbi:MAG: tetratricopeptide repeat protein [Cyanobacteria bacterium]|nr:tetratricopeptide repeat protein [Cyanobacteriota bacterium]